jgi:hypothetical protein
MHSVENMFDVQKLQAIAEHVYSLNSYRLMLDIENGKSNPDVVAKFLNLSAQDTAVLKDLHDARLLGNVTDDMRNRVLDIVRSEYVPMTGHPLASIDGAEDGVFSAGAAQPNTQKSFSMEGRTRGIADNGIATTMTSLVRSASFAGFADFTTGISEVHGMLSQEQRDAVGLSREDNVSGLVRSSDNMMLDGRTGNKVGYVIQDRRVLESIRKANVEAASSLMYQFIRPVTKAFSYLVTQANPMFGPTNMANDLIERSIIASTREYHTESGSKVTIGAMDVIANSAQALGAAVRLIRGKPDYTKQADEALRDIIDRGGMSLSRDTFARSSADLAKQVVAAGAGTGVGTVKRVLGRAIENYNSVFDMVAPLSSYLALRSAGVSSVDAAGGALDLMNFRKGGEHMQLFTSTIAFAQPAVTGGANMLRALGTKKGKQTAAVALIGFTAMQLLAQAGADDDEGGNLLLQLPDYMRNNNINIQAAGYTFSIPVGFGITRLANTVARIGIDMKYKGTTPLSALQDIANDGLLPALTPFEEPKIKDPLKRGAYALSPTVLKPLVSTWFNANPQGGTIDNEKWIDKDKYRHLQGSKNIAPEYRSLAKVVFDMSGGMLDWTPEATKTIVNGYALGPMRVAVAELITNPDREAKGKETGVPIIGALVSARAKPINDDAWKAQVREAQGEMEELHKELNKLKAETTPEARIALRELQSRPEYKMSLVYDEMDKRMRNESAQVTRGVTSKQITASAAEIRKQDIKERRSDEEAKFLVKWRRMKGLE